MSTFDSMPLEEQPDGFGGLPALWRGAGHCRLTGGQPALAGPDGQNERWLAAREEAPAASLAPRRRGPGRR
jgi:hypothetical protein